MHATNVCCICITYMYVVCMLSKWILHACIIHTYTCILHAQIMHAYITCLLHAYYIYAGISHMYIACILHECLLHVNQIDAYYIHV